jgi:hypothetical protein
LLRVAGVGGLALGERTKAVEAALGRALGAEGNGQPAKHRYAPQAMKTTLPATNAMRGCSAAASAPKVLCLMMGVECVVTWGVGGECCGCLAVVCGLGVVSVERVPWCVW